MQDTSIKKDISPADISRVAFMNWEKDGCPPGRDMDYWLQAESQLKATWHLHAEEHGLGTKAKAETNSESERSKPGVSLGKANPNNSRATNVTGRIRRVAPRRRG